MSDSIQHKLDRVRPPRVQITYDVDTGNAIVMKELPFKVGIMADLSGNRNPDTPMKAWKERKPVDIDRDNFSDIMKDINPRLAFQAKNVLDPKATTDTDLNVLLNFKSMDDFEPVNIIKQNPVMSQMYAARTKLHDLLSKLDGNDNLEKLLQNVLRNSDVRSEFQQSITKAQPLVAPTPGQVDPKPSEGRASVVSTPKGDLPPSGSLKTPNPAVPKPGPKK